MIKPYFKNLNRESLAASFKSLSTIYEQKEVLYHFNIFLFIRISTKGKEKETNPKRENENI